MKTKRLSVLSAVGVFCFALLVFFGCDNPSTPLTLEDLKELTQPPPKPGPSLTPGDGYLYVQFTKVVGATGYRIYWNTVASPDPTDPALDSGSAANCLNEPDFAGVCPIESPDPANTRINSTRPRSARRSFQRSCRRFVRKGLKGCGAATERRAARPGAEGPERGSAEPRKARSVLAPDAPK